MKRIALAALLLLALGAGGVRAEESPAAHRTVSGPADVWAALVELVTSIFVPGQEPTSQPAAMRGDCGVFIDPTGGCRG